MNKKEQLFKLANEVSAKKTEQTYQSILTRAEEAARDGQYMFKPFFNMRSIDWTKILKDLRKEGFDAKVDSYVDKGDFTQIRLAIYWYSETPNQIN